MSDTEYSPSWTMQYSECVATLNQLADDFGADFLSSLLETFQVAGAKLVDDIVRGSLAEDNTLVKIAAHALKSNAKTFGLNELAKLCEQLEIAGKEGRLDEVAALTPNVTSAFTAGQQLLGMLCSSFESVEISKNS